MVAITKHSSSFFTSHNDVAKKQITLTMIEPAASADNANLCLNNSRYPAQPHPKFINYYTTLLKIVKITRKTSTNIQRYSDK